jgi:hypothetical protein
MSATGYADALPGRIEHSVDGSSSAFSVESLVSVRVNGCCTFRVLHLSFSLSFQCV